MNKKNVLLAILILLIIGAFVGYKMYNKPHLDVGQTKTDVAISSIQLMKEFSQNEEVSNQKYLDKVLEVEGRVVKITNKDGKGIITLETDDDFGNVLCHLSNEGLEGISKVKEGEMLTIKGICTGFLMDVILIKCELLN